MNQRETSAADLHATGADGPYWNALAQGRLELPRCSGCDHWHWPAVFRCGHCGSWEMKWEAVELRGRLFSWTRSWHAFGGSEGLGVPYVSLIVELPQAGDRRVLGVLLGDDAGLAIGASVIGETSTTPFENKSIPSLRWRIAS